jgi:hypothetical protein
VLAFGIPENDSLYPFLAEDNGYMPIDLW